MHPPTCPLIHLSTSLPTNPSVYLLTCYLSDTHPCTNLHTIPPTGKRTVRVREVPVNASSLTQGDVYILDAGLLIYIFCGPTANMFEKTKGTCVCVGRACVGVGGGCVCVCVCVCVCMYAVPLHSALTCTIEFYSSL
jgi:hypothetical protein